MSSTINFVVYFNVFLSIFSVLVVLISSMWYYIKRNDFFIEKRRPNHVLVLVLVLLPMYFQTAWDPLVAADILHYNVYWKIFGWIGAGIAPTTCQFVYAARYWHIVFDINYHTSLLNEWFNQLDSSLDKNKNWWIINYQKWGITKNTSIICALFSILIPLVGHLPVRYLSKHWYLYQYWLIEPIVYGSMMSILIIAYNKAKQKHTRLFDEDILFIHEEFWKILYWVMLMFVPIILIGCIVYAISAKAVYLVTVHAIGVNLLGLILVYYIIIFPLLLSKKRKYQLLNLKLGNNNHLPQLKVISSSTLRKTSVDDIQTHSCPKYLKDLLQSEEEIRSFVKFCSDSLASENFFGYVEILQLVKQYESEDDQNKDSKDSSTNSSTNDSMQLQLPNKKGIGLTLSNYQLHKAITDINIEWIPINCNITKSYKSGCIYIYNKYIKSNCNMPINISFNTLVNIKKELLKIRRKKGSISISISIIPNIEKESNVIELNNPKSIFNDCLNELWDNMESIFNLYRFRCKQGTL